MSWSAPWRSMVADQAVAELAAVIDPRSAALVRVLRDTALSWSEAVALRRRCCFPSAGSIEVVEEAVETPAGIRFRTLRHDGWASIRDETRAALAEHLVRFVGEPRTALVFTDYKNGPLSAAWFREAVWLPALQRCGLPIELSVDDLQVARLRAWQEEASTQRAELRGGVA